MRQQLFGGGNYAEIIPAGSTKWSPPHGSTSWLGNPEIRNSQVIPASGTLTSLLIELSGAPGAGESFTFTIRVNSAEPANTLSVVISDANTQGLDRTHSVAVVAGDYITLQCVSTAGVDITRWARWSFIFTGTNAGESIIIGGNADPLSSAATEYCHLQGGACSWNVSAVLVYQVMPTAGVISDLHVVLEASPGVNPDGYRFRLMVNGVLPVGTLDCTVTDPATTASDLVNSVAVVAGDLVCIQCDPLNVPAATPSAHWGLIFTPTVDGEFVLLGGSADPLNNAATEYNCENAQNIIWRATKDQRTQGCQVGTTISRLYIWLNDAPGAGTTWRFKIRFNAGDAGLVVDIANAAQTGSDLVNTFPLADYGDIAIMSEPLVGAPIVTHAHWGMVGEIQEGGAMGGMANKLIDGGFI